MINTATPIFSRPLLTTLVLAALASSPALAAPLWQEAAAPAAQERSDRAVRATKSRWVEVDVDAVSATMRRMTAAKAAKAAAPTAPTTLELPMPDGSSLTLHLQETQVMAPGLAARYPEIRTFAGRVPGQPEVTARLDLSPKGLRAQVFTPQGRALMDPAESPSGRLHQVTWARDQVAARKQGSDEVLLPPQAPSKRAVLAAAARPSGMTTTGDKLLTYRFALAATGEYSRFMDPKASPSKKGLVLAEMVTLTNRISGVFEREIGVQLQLIDNVDSIIYTDPASDPYSNADQYTMLAENMNNLRAVLGDAAFDLGHVVGTGGGGVAYLGVACGSHKAGGVTGLDYPVGDDFYIDFVAHELGHQLGANHTFNGQQGNCNGNRREVAAYEPGSGSTIMSYAGICMSDDIQSHDDPHFHSISYQEIVNHTRLGSGASCGRLTNTGNRAPRVFTPNGGFTIPVNTPFELSGKAVDDDGDKLSYQWEQRDLGGAGSPNRPDATAPLFRSFVPSASPTRVFPQVSDLINNRQTQGEILPAVSRALNFRFTVRDNRSAPSAGGVGSADLSFNVTANAGPFRVTSPNTTASYRPKALLNVTWDVARTDQAPVSCRSVDVSLSTDGGRSFGKTLALAVPNTGMAMVRLPAQTSSTARIKVKCSNNVFFDISNANFRIQ